MAARPRITAATPRQYEDFQPSSSLLQEKHGETLTVELTGFTKDQIKVQMNDRTRTIMISGERPMGNNKWRRFRKELQVPINCNTSEIQAKFENGVLKITMPLKTEEPKSGQHPIILPKLAPLPIPVPPQTPHPKPAMDSKLATAASQPRPAPKPAPVATPPPSQKPTAVPKQYSQPPPPPPLPPSIQKQDAGLKPTATTQSRLSEKLNPMSAPYHPLIPKHATDLKDKITEKLTKHATDLKDKITEKLTQDQEPRIKPKLHDSHDDQKPGPSKITEKIIDLKTSRPDQDGATKIVGASKEAGTGDNRGKLGDKIKEYTEGAKNASKSVGMDWDDQSKQLVINMVAAVLLIIGLYLHVKYTIKFPEW